MKQCLLAQGTTHTVTWVDDWVTKGMTVEGLGLGNKKWTVEEVYSHIMAEPDLKQKQRYDRGSLPSLSDG